MSILPTYVVIVGSVCVALTVRARLAGALSLQEFRSVCLILAAMGVWLGAAVFLGLGDAHVRLMEKVPFLWQAFVPMAIWMVPFALSRTVRRALWSVGTATPAHWLVLLQAMRIGAIGGIIKGLENEILSDYVFWIGIPDFLFGLSALAVAWIVWRFRPGTYLLTGWNIIGFALIVFPTFAAMPYWMGEPGFEFIFEFPMILAPGFVVSMLVSLNLLQAWVSWKQWFHSTRHV